MKYLHLNNVNFDQYDYYGFDMDGTLYNEQLFIEQIYIKISHYFSPDSKVVALNIYDWMLQRWIKKGSSYPYIFEETIQAFNIKNKTIEDALSIYRTSEPNLLLEINVKEIIEKIPLSKRFLITDGHPHLQRSKYRALSLENYFMYENCCFTGDLGRNFYKPSRLALRKLVSVQSDSKIIYFGDRLVDEQFCLNTGMDFVHVQNFQDFWGLKE